MARRRTSKTKTKTKAKVKSVGTDIHGEPVETEVEVLETVADKVAEVPVVSKKDAKFFESMKPQAKEIIARLDRATVSEGKADDLRLSAAQIMTTVEGKFLKAKPKDVKFKDWCETSGICSDDIKGRSWENLRKLLAVGKSENPVAALEDLRAANAAANKRARDKAKVVSEGSGDGDGGTRQQRAVVDPVEMIASIISGLAEQNDITTLLEIGDIVATAIDMVDSRTHEEAETETDEAEDAEVSATIAKAEADVAEVAATIAEADAIAVVEEAMDEIETVLDEAEVNETDEALAMIEEATGEVDPFEVPEFLK